MREHMSVSEVLARILRTHIKLHVRTRANKDVRTHARTFISLYANDVSIRIPNNANVRQHLSTWVEIARSKVHDSYTFYLLQDVYT